MILGEGRLKNKLEDFMRDLQTAKFKNDIRNSR